MTEYMQLALAEARKALLLGEVPVGAVLVKDGHVLCAAHNLRETTADPTAHAEMLCLREGARLLGDWRLRGCTLYVTLEPCPMCAGSIALAQLDACIYGAHDRRMGCCGSLYDLLADPAIGSRTTWQSGLMEDECAAILAEFFQTIRAK